MATKREEFDAKEFRVTAKSEKSILGQGAKKTQKGMKSYKVDKSDTERVEPMTTWNRGRYQEYKHRTIGIREF